MENSQKKTNSGEGIEFNSSDIRERDDSTMFSRVQETEENLKAAADAAKKQQKAEERQQKEAEKQVKDAKKAEHKEVRRTRLDRMRELFWDGKRKIFTIIVLLALVSGLAYAWVKILNRADTAKAKKEYEESLHEINEETAESIEARNDLFQKYISGDITKEEADSGYNDIIENAKNQSSKIMSKIEYASFVAYAYHDEGKAVDLMEEIESSVIELQNPAVFYEYYSKLGYIYYLCNNDEKSEEYAAKADYYIRWEEATDEE